MKLFQSMTIILPVLFLSTALITSPAEAQSKKKKQGIFGIVSVRTGNHMPGPSIGVQSPAPPPSSKEKQAIKTILIYQLTKRDQASETDGVFYSNFKTKLVQTIHSKKNGQYIAYLEPGKYSVFVKEPKGLFANRSEGDGSLNPITVQRNKMAELIITVDYEAAY